jgi:hypothetical protein
VGTLDPERSDVLSKIRKDFCRHQVKASPFGDLDLIAAVKHLIRDASSNGLLAIISVVTLTAASWMFRNRLA